MTSVCCCSCFNILKQKFGENHAIIWREFCRLNGAHGPIIPMTSPDIPEIRDLEIFGYLKTHETPGLILIRLNGEKQDSMNQSLFCPGGDHV